MITSRYVLAGALLAAVLGLIAALGVAREPAKDAGVPRETAPATLEPRSRTPASALAQLGLSDAQLEQIGRLGMREHRRLEELQQAVAATERNLRWAELAQPFDAERVNRLVARRSELAAYLRGTESRMVSEIAALLTPDQQRRFAELRVAGATAAPRDRTSQAPRATSTGRRHGACTRTARS